MGPNYRQSNAASGAQSDQGRLWAVTAPRTARERNEEIAGRLPFTPTPIAGTAANGNKPGFGVALAGQF